MGVETSVKLKLSIWRNFIPSRQIISWDEEGGAPPVEDLGSNLQEEVYSWYLREDYLGGISDDETRRRLEERIDRLKPNNPPSERRLSALEEFITQAREAIDSGDAELSAVQNPAVDDEDAPRAINALLMLTLHLDWLLRCFENRPGISVSIR